MDQSLALPNPERRSFAFRELTDLIIDQLAEDSKMLKSCSLVSRQWIPRSRYHLLRVVSFADSLSGRSLGRWCATFGASNVAAAGLTRELHFRQMERLWIHPAILSRHMSHISHFTNVTTLVFVNLVAAVFDAASLTNCFEPFIPRVRTLRIRHPIARPTSLMQIILLFSAAVDIQISFPQWSVAGENPILLPLLVQEDIGFTGILHLCGFGEKWSEFFTLLSARRLRFQKIRLIGCESSTSTPTQALLEAASQSTSALHLAGPGRQRIYSSVTLHTFNVLKRFAFTMTESGINGVELAMLLDSISSLRFSLLVLDVSNRERRSADRGDIQAKQFFGEMKELDRPLSRLANRTLQGTGKRFTLILLANSPIAITGAFPEFQKVGNTWKGERLIGGRSCDYYWTFTAAKGCEDQTVDDSPLRFLNI